VDQLNGGYPRLSDPYESVTTEFRSDGHVDFVRDKQGNRIDYVYDADGRLIAQTTNRNQSLAFDYSSDGMLIQASDSNRRKAKFSYSGLRLESVENPEQGVVRYEYDSRGFLSGALNPDGKRALSNSYNSKGMVTSQRVGSKSGTMRFTFGKQKTVVHDAEGNWARIRYDRFGRTSSVTTKRAGRVVLHRNQRGRVFEITRSDGRSAKLDFDTRGRVIRSDSFSGEHVSTQYDGNSNVHLVTDELGHATEYVYNSDNTVREVTNPDGKKTEYSWENGLLKSVKNPAHETTSYERDIQGRITAETDPSGEKTLQEYDEHGYVDRVTDQLHHVTRFDYSSMGHMKESIDEAGARTKYEYDDNGNLTKTIDPLGNESTTTFDEQQQPVDTYLNGKLKSRTVYDELGRVVSTMDGNGDVERSFYGPDGRLARTVTAEHETTSYRYDELGRVSAEIDPKGNRTSFEYDLDGNLTAVVDATGARTTYVYDGAGRMKRQTDAKGHATKYDYTDGGALERIEKPGGQITSLEYDEAGRLSARVVAGERTGFAYDLNGRLTTVTLANGQTQHFTYDQAGRMTSADAGNGQVTNFAHDYAGRVTETSDALGMTTTYSYDSAGKISSSTDPSGTTSYEYDDQLRPNRLTTPSGRVHRFDYDGEDNVIRARVFRPTAGGEQLVLSTTRSFDRSGRLTDSETRDARGSLLGSLAYVYDENGNPTKRATDKSEQLYAYDQLNRLIRVTFAGSGEERTDTYGYDAVSNRTQKNGEVYSYNENDQLIAAPGGQIYSYDPQGRRTARSTPSGTETYQWDSLDQLTFATSSSGASSTFSYDAQGRLVSLSRGGFSRSYNYALSDSPVRVASSIAGSGGMLREEVNAYGPTGLIEVGRGDAAPGYPLLDAQGTPLVEAQEQGTATVLAELDPFGVAVLGEAADAALIDQRSAGYLGGAGRIDLPGLELVKLGARYLDANNGAFLSVDPVVGAAEEPVRRVSYVYAGSNPAAWSDLDGRSFGRSIVGAPGSAIKWIKTQAEQVSIDLGETSSDPNASVIEQFSANFYGALTSLANCESFNETAENLLSFAIPVGPLRGIGVGVGKVWAIAKGAGKGGAWYQRAQALGDAGEEAVRRMYDIGPKERIPMPGGGYRIPDGVNKQAVSEVKNVKYQGWTKQLRDYADYAASVGKEFHLYLRDTTVVSGSLRRAAREKKVILRKIPDQK
jgi:YD repeat-containing protein